MRLLGVFCFLAIAYEIYWGAGQLIMGHQTKKWISTIAKITLAEEISMKLGNR